MVHAQNSLFLPWRKTYRISDSSEEVERGRGSAETEAKGCPLSITFSPSRSWTYRKMTNSRFLFLYRKEVKIPVKCANWVKYRQSWNILLLQWFLEVSNECSTDTGRNQFWVSQESLTTTFHTTNDTGLGKVSLTLVPGILPASWGRCGAQSFRK